MNNSSQSGITLMETLLYLGLLGLILTTAASLSLQSMEFLSKADQSLSTTGEVLFLVTFHHSK
jgi:Tfp pilus assembly protein PilV